MTVRRTVAAVAVAALGLALTTTGSSPAPGAAAAPAPGSSCPGADESSSSARLDRTVAPAGAEEGYVEDAYQRALARGEQAADGSVRRAGTVPVPVRIRVHVHVIQDNDVVGLVSDATIADQIAVLNDSYAGVANSSVGTGANTDVSFVLVSTDRTVNADWYPMAYQGAPSVAMKSALHQGGRRDLNLYFTDISSGILGWATFPDEFTGNPQLDGVVVDNATVPGGSATAYNRGFTATHEVGHWLGLFHTFEGGCDGGDLVDDTAAEAFEHYGCSTGSDSCPAVGPDPVHNFMDYSDDSCMYEFTAGQGQRIQDQTEGFRNSPPIFSATTLSTPRQTPVTLPAPTDTDGDAVTVAITSAPAHGTATLNAGSVTYTPAAGFTGQDQFTVGATDAFGAAALPATVVVNVTAPASDHRVALRVTADRKQKLRNLAISGSCGAEGCTVKVTGTVTVQGRVHGKPRTKSFHLAPATATSPAGGRATLPLTVKGAKVVAKLLKAGWTGTAIAKVVATDAAGNRASHQATVRLK